MIYRCDDAKQMKLSINRNAAAQNEKLDGSKVDAFSFVSLFIVGCLAVNEINSDMQKALKIDKFKVEKFIVWRRRKFNYLK